MNRRIGAWIAGVVALGGLVSAAPAGAAALPCNNEQVILKTLHIEVDAPKKTLRAGDRIKIGIEISRPAHEDPTGLGQPIDPPTSQPAAEIDVGAGISVGDVFVYDVAITDAEGRATLNIKLPKYTPTGQAVLDVLARKVQARSTCAEVWELGYRQFPSAFAVKR